MGLSNIFTPYLGDFGEDNSALDMRMGNWAVFLQEGIPLQLGILSEWTGMNLPLQMDVLPVRAGMGLPLQTGILPVRAGMRLPLQMGILPRGPVWAYRPRFLEQIRDEVYVKM